MRKIIKIEGMACGHCAMTIESALKELEGVLSAKVNLLEGNCMVEGEGLEGYKLRKAVIDAGYQVVSVVP